MKNFLITTFTFIGFIGCSFASSVPHGQLTCNPKDEGWPCADVPETYNKIFYGGPYGNLSTLNTIEYKGVTYKSTLSNFLNHYNNLDLYGYDNPIIAANFVTSFGLAATNSALPEDKKFIREYAYFNYKFIYKLLTILRKVKNPDKLIAILERLNKKIEKIKQIVDKKWNYYSGRANSIYGTDKDKKNKKKYEIYDKILRALKVSNQLLIVYTKLGCEQKYLKNTDVRQKFKNWEILPLTNDRQLAIEKAEWRKQMEDRKRRIEAERKKRDNKQGYYYPTIQQLENYFNCHNYPLPNNVNIGNLNLDKNKLQKLIGLAVCIMEKYGLPKDIGDKFLYYDYIVKDNISESYTTLGVETINGVMNIYNTKTFTYHIDCIIIIINLVLQRKF